MITWIASNPVLVLMIVAALLVVWLAYEAMKSNERRYTPPPCKVCGGPTIHNAFMADHICPDHGPQGQINTRGQRMEP